MLQMIAHQKLAFCYPTALLTQNPQLIHPTALIFGIENVFSEVTGKQSVITLSMERKSEHR